MQTELKFTTLGKLVIWQNDVILDNFISTKATLLFVYLAMNPGEQSRKKLANLFWSETTDDQALKNLRTVLSSIRQKAPDGLAVSREALAINPDVPIEIDATLFENGCKQIATNANTLDQLKSMQALADLYQGSFLESIVVRDAPSLDQWINDTQQRLYQQYTQLLFEIVEAASKQSQYDIALEYSHKLVSIDPLWEVAQRQFMRLLALTDRTNEALVQYERFTRLVKSELQTDPDPETTELYEQIRSGEIVPPKTNTQHSVVLPDMPFVEPTEDVEIAQRMLNTPQCRLMTIFGISGIGKTTLAIQLAYHRQHLYADGTYVISLKHEQSARDLPYAIAGTLNIDYSNQTDHHALESIIIEQIRDLNILLVLDNYEHLLPETDFLQHMLEQTRRAQFIVTSQAPLNLFREWLMPLNGLRVPSPEESSPENYESVQLFEVIARRTNPRFNLQDNLDGVVKICQLLDGLPLALVIAAGWTQIVPVNKIAEYILEGQEFNLPVQQSLPSRHQSLEMMFEYTWSTLDAIEQQALTALSIFNTSCDLDEIQQICDVDLVTLATLIQKSLIQKFDDKYRMHQLVWRYARKKLVFDPRKELLSQQYLTYYTHQLELLQRNKPLVHEYVINIEMQYASIWNYSWMSKSFQAEYMISISRFLITYWEISRADDLPMIRQLFEQIDQRTLLPATRLLLNLYLARMYMHGNHYSAAHNHLQMALNESDHDVPWSTLTLLFNLYSPLYHVVQYGMEHLTDTDNLDEFILRRSYLKLASLYLDMGNYEEAEGLFIHLSESATHPVDCACILAIRGTIAAQVNLTHDAESYLADALHCLSGIDEPNLQRCIENALLQVRI